METEYFDLNTEQQEYLNISIMKALFEMLYKTEQITKKEYDLFLHRIIASYS